MACPRLLTALILATAFPVDGALAQMPPAIAAPGEDIVATFHAEGAQIYECKPGNEGKLAWVFREPIATLLLDDKTVGRHYAGPTWEHGDGSAVTGKAVGNAPGATVNATVQRINSHGGAAQGACDQAGAFRSVPYSADYVFLSAHK
jgi:hypothetical protein